MTPPSVPYRIIPLTQGQVAYVSPSRYDDVNRFKWFAFRAKNINNYYAARSGGRDANGRDRPMIFMHRYILGLKAGDKLTADHIDHHRTLDNTDENLRVATRFQQNCNQGLVKRNTSGYKGIWWCAKERKWIARIQINGKKIWLGRFDEAPEAHAAYCAAAKHYHGEFANPTPKERNDGC